MSEKKKPGRSSGFSRREALGGLFGGGLGALALPVEAGHPVHGHLSSPGSMAAASEAATSGSGPAFLSSHQLETLSALAERIVPGSSEAAVAPFVDKLLDVDTEETRRDFLASLSAFEAAAQREFGRPVVQLTAGEQDRLLEQAAAAEAKLGPPRGWGRFGGAEGPAEPGLDLGRHLRHLKGWISGAYYTSEKGLRELGWTGNMAFEGFPGCTHGGHA